MFAAALAGNVDILRQALEAGAPVNLMDPSSADTPMIIGCRTGSAEVVKLCLDYGGSNDPHPTFGQTALHAAVAAAHIEPCKVAMCKFLFM